MRMDGTPDPACQNPLTLRLWSQPDGNLGHEVRDVRVTATHTAWSLGVTWSTTVAANDLAVQDIPITALGLVLDVVCSDREMELELSEPGARLDDSGRVMYPGWYETHPD